MLRHIVDRGTPVPLEELASDLGLHTSIVYRAVRSLVAAGFIQREPTGGYCVGTGLLSMSVALASRIDIRTAVRPVMQAVVAEFGETASLHIRSGDKRVCVETVDGTHAVRRVIPVGETLPLYAGETGRVFLSTLPPAEVAEFVDAAIAAGLDGARLERDLVAVRKKGYFIGIGERTKDVGAISVALWGPSAMLAVMTVSGPATRWSRAAMEAASGRILKLTKPFAGERHA
ncbi:MAG: IclR family transcriptional regulator [Rhodospirillales bacterium]|nr:IclR family transcriptional regulator [Rhodospirillales bacterium]